MDSLLVATAHAETRHFWFQGFRRFIVPLVERATRGRPEAQILDCGCGTGANVDLLSRYGRAFGFDLTAMGLQIGHRAGRTRLARASVTAVPFPDNTFDLVTSFDVLYALHDPDERAAIAEMHRVAKPGGYVLINVAANEALRGDHSVLGREVRRYSRARLNDVLRRAGFEIQRLTYTNAVLFLPILLVRAAQRFRGLAAESDAAGDISVPPGLVNGVLAAALRVESWWLPYVDNPFGSSLLCLARKPA
jgi:SAM-dependent methyltransferase